MARCSALRMAAKAGLKCRCRRACSTSTHWLAASGARLPPACLILRAGQVSQLAEECFGIFQRCCVETLDEPPINRLQEGIGLQAFALVAPMLGEGGRGAQLPPTRLLLLCNRQCPSQSSLRLTSPAQR